MPHASIAHGVRFCLHWPGIHQCFNLGWGHQLKQTNAHVAEEEGEGAISLLLLSREVQGCPEMKLSSTR